jgi:hypothetical protein
LARDVHGNAGGNDCVTRSIAHDAIAHDAPHNVVATREASDAERHGSFVMIFKMLLK